MTVDNGLKTNGLTFKQKSDRFRTAGWLDPCFLMGVPYWHGFKGIEVRQKVVERIV